MNQTRCFWRSLALVVTLSAVSVVAMYFDAKPVWLGLPIVYILITCAGLIGGKYVGAATGLLSTSIGLYIKINHFFVPEKLRAIPENLTGEKLEKLQKQIATFHTTMEGYTETLSKYAILIVLAGIGLGFVVGLFFKRTRLADETPRHSGKFQTKSIVYMSVFIALAVAINTLRIGNISFGGFPIIYSGLALGAIPGFIVGAVADVIGFFMRPGNGDFNWLFCLTSGLTGMIPALFFMIPGFSRFKNNAIFIFFSILIAQLVTSVGIVPVGRYWLYQHPYIVTLTNAIIKQAYSIPLYTFFYITLDNAIGKNFSGRPLQVKTSK